MSNAANAAIAPNTARAIDSGSIARSALAICCRGDGGDDGGRNRLGDLGLDRGDVTVAVVELQPGQQAVGAATLSQAVPRSPD